MFFLYSSIEINVVAQEEQATCSALQSVTTSVYVAILGLSF